MLEKNDGPKEDTLESSWKVDRNMIADSTSHAIRKAADSLSKDTNGCCEGDPRIRQQGRGGRTDLPTGIAGETTNLHPVRGATGARSTAFGAVTREGAIFSVARTACELDRQALSHKSRTIFVCCTC